MNYSYNCQTLLSVILLVGSQTIKFNTYKYLEPMMTDFNLVYPNYPTDDKYEKNDFIKKRYKIPLNRPVRIYVDGIYDLFHFGHMLNFKQAKELFPSVYLIVGICNDELTHKYKGRTVLSYEERVESLRHCRYVDEIIEDAPWSFGKEHVEKYSIDYVAHDDEPYIWNNKQHYKRESSEVKSSDDSLTRDDTTTEISPDDVYYYVKSNGMFIPTLRTKGISTSGIITRIVKDYDEFVRRNLERGVSAKDLNVGIIDENIYKVKNKMQMEIDTAKYEINIAYKFWEDKTKEFLKLYEKNVLQRIRDAFSKDENEQNGLVRACKKMVDRVKNKK